jgi:aldehyde dehydrogenase (NAD+)
MGNPKLEAFFGEVAPSSNAVSIWEDIEEWSKPEIVDIPVLQKPWVPTVHRRSAYHIVSRFPLLLIPLLKGKPRPWNYPMILTFRPLIGAVALW